MVYNIDLLKEFRIYRGGYRLFPKDMKNRRKNTIVLLNTKNIQETINLLNDKKKIDTKYFLSYYTPYKQDIITNIKKVYRFEQASSYKSIRSTKQAKIQFTKRELKDYKNDNLLYDLSSMNNIFFNSSTSLPVRKKSTFYIDNIKQILSQKELSQYDKQYMIIPFDTPYTNIYDQLVRPDILDNPISAFISLVLFNNTSQLSSLKNLTCIITSTKNNLFIKFNPSNLTKENIQRFVKLLTINNKLLRKEELTEEEKLILDQSKFEIVDTMKQDTLEAIKDDISNVISNNLKVEGLTGNVKSSHIQDTVDDIIEDELSKKEITLDNKLKVEKEVIESLENNDEFKKHVMELKDEKLKAAKAARMTKRDELLRENQKKIQYEGKTLEEILTDFNDKKIDRTPSTSKAVVHDYIKHSTLVDFEKSYNEKQYLKDQVNILSSFSDDNKQIPLFIKDIKKEDSSDDFTYKDTLTVHFEDANRLRHTFKIDIPRIVDNKYFYVNGNKKGIIKQLTLKPVVKTAPDTVQVVSSCYNKIFVTRYGQKVSPKMTRFKKLLLENKLKGVIVKSGDCCSVNSKYLTNIDYDECAKVIQNLEIGEDIFISFNQNILREYLEELKIDISELPTEILPIGVNKKSVILLNVNTNFIEGTNKDLLDYICDLLYKHDNSIKDIIANIKVGKKFMYSRAHVVSKKIPLLVLLAYKDGLTTVLKKANINYEFSDKRRNMTFEEKNTKGVVQFADGYLIYDMYPYKNSLLLNALAEMDTKLYPYEAFDRKEVYLEILNNLLGSRTFGKALDNYYQLFIDPITKEVLEDLNLPTDFVELFLYANALLEDNAYVKESDISNYRIRSNEIINAHLYRILADAYSLYKDTSNTSNPIKVSVPQDKLMKDLMASVLVEDVNILNPAVEATVQCTYKGLGGLNLDEAYNLEKRAYSKSMVGVLGFSSPNNNKVGVVRELSWNSNILSTRGYVQPADDESIKEMNPSSLGTASELLTAFALGHDDPLKFLEGSYK